MPYSLLMCPLNGTQFMVRSVVSEGDGSRCSGIKVASAQMPVTAGRSGEAVAAAPGRRQCNSRQAARFGGENAVNHNDFPGQDQQERAGDPARVHPARPDHRQGDRSRPKEHQQIAGEASPLNELPPARRPLAGRVPL